MLLSRDGLPLRLGEIGNAMFARLSAANNLGTLKSAAIVLAFATGLLVVRAAVDPRSVLRDRLFRYAARLDDELATLRRARKGNAIAALQVVAIATATALAIALHLWQFLLVGMACALGPPLWLDALVAQRNRVLQDQVNGFALSLSSAMRTTANITDALRIASRVTGGPLGEEIEIMLAQMSLGASLDDTLEDLALRAPVPAIEVLTMALLIGRKTGGDLPRLMETTATSLREIQKLEAVSVKALSDSKRGFIMLAATVPAGFFGFKLLMPMVVNPFLASPGGQQAIVYSIAAYALCLMLGWKMVQVDV